MLKFGIEHWDAWTPGIRDKADWMQFLSDTSRRPVPADTVDYRYLKPRQRRRLSDNSKITLDVAFGAISSEPEGRLNIPTVFASRRGEVNRMAGLLRDICAGDDASPTAFSLSVHNTTSGLFSIQSGNQAPSTAIAAGHDTLVAALVEACAQLANGQERVMLVISEEAMPNIYSAFACEHEHPVAAAFVLNASEQYQLELLKPSTPTPTPVCEQVFQLLRLLISNKPALITGERMPCRILPV